jgi:hypothetical protein
MATIFLAEWRWSGIGVLEPCDERPNLEPREVKLGGFYRVAGRGPSGSPRTPRSRSLRETIAAAGRAPSP